MVEHVEVRDRLPHCRKLVWSGSMIETSDNITPDMMGIRCKVSDGEI